MKIICTVTNDLTYDQRMIRIGTSLAKAGYEVVLVGRRKKSSKPLMEQLFEQKRLSCFFEKGKFFYIEYNIRLFLYLLFQRTDVINSIDLDTLLAGYWVCKLRGKTCIYDAHEYFTEVPELVERPRIQKIWKGIEKSILPKLQYGYTVCESLAELFEKEYQLPFEVIRNVPFQRPVPNPLARADKRPVVVLYQGALNDGRGIEQTIDALPLLPEVELWLAGEGDLSEVLRQKVKEQQLEAQVKFLGYVTPDKLKDLTPQATIGINLLENKGLNYYYSLANKAFDYIQAGIPSIHVNFPEYQKINQQYDTFVLIDDLKAETIAEAIQGLLNDADLYQRLQTNCIAAREVLNWEREEEKLKAFYSRTGL